MIPRANPYAKEKTKAKESATATATASFLSHNAAKPKPVPVLTLPQQQPHVPQHQHARQQQLQPQHLNPHTSSSSSSPLSSHLDIAASAMGSTFSQVFHVGDDPHDDESIPAQHLSLDRMPLSESGDRERPNHPQPQPLLPPPPPQQQQQQSGMLLCLDANPHVLFVSQRQQGNSVLRHIRNVPWMFEHQHNNNNNSSSSSSNSSSRNESPMPMMMMIPDYVWSTTRCALFLSLQYHALHKHYILSRMSALKALYTVRVLLVRIDMDDPTAQLLRQLNTLAVRNHWTLLYAWSDEEAARYLETFKAMDGKDARLIQRPLKSTFCEQVMDVLTEVQGLNKTDAGQLLSQFGTVRSLVMASPDELGLVAGMGPVKVQRLHDAFHKPFVVTTTTSSSSSSSSRQAAHVDHSTINKTEEEIEEIEETELEDSSKEKDMNQP